MKGSSRPIAVLRRKFTNPHSGLPALAISTYKWSNKLRFFVTSDANWESKVDHAARVLNLGEFFENREYGEGIAGGIVVVLMCRDPSLGLKQRIRFSKKEQKLYLDIMLNLPEFVEATHPQRRDILARHLLGEIPNIIRKYKLKDFDLESFISDLSDSVTQQLLGEDASRYDHQCLERATGF